MGRLLGWRLVLLAGLALAAAEVRGEDAWALQARRDMVAEIAAIARETGAETGRSVFSPAVMAAMGRVARHRFVPAAYLRQAYANRPLPIGHGQTISQPYIVALMSELAELRPGEAVLEIGSGSGYQAAVASEIAGACASIEIIEPLGRAAQARLSALGYRVEVRIGDGYHGWPERAPFDAILVTAAASHIPPPLVRQLKPGGRMVIPVGAPFALQHLVLVRKAGDGSVSTEQIVPVRFVPLAAAAPR